MVTGQTLPVNQGERPGSDHHVLNCSIENRETQAPAQDLILVDLYV